MAEHISRYDEFASYLNQNGILVVGNDHAGHGKSISENAIKGYFGNRDGWRLLIEDMRRLYDKTAALYPDVPYILFGHSAGSFLARAYAVQYGEGIAAFVFSGTAGKNTAIPLGRLIARLEMLRNGHAKPSKLLDKMSFGTYNKAFKPVRTAFDWLSRDTAQVDAYVADQLCGFVFTAETAVPGVFMYPAHRHAKVKVLATIQP
jgi:alpha-beta hydrolase superfamily lysophospholipase